MAAHSHFRAADRIRGLGPSARLLALVACILLFAMMIIVFIDVLGRYLFLAPLPAAYELVSLIMPATIFCALPLTMLREGHVTVDLLDALIPPRLETLQRVVVNLISTGALALVAWRLWVRSIDQAEYGEITDALFLPLWPFSAGMSVLCAVAALAALATAGRHAARWFRRG